MSITGNSDFSILQLHSDQCILAETQTPARDLLTLAWEGRTVIADWEDRQAEAQLAEFAQALGPRLLVPEVWRQVFPQTGILISAALSGGTLREHFQEAIQEAPGRCWLKLEPVRMRFSLPCPTGCGKVLSQEALESRLIGKQTFFSEELCCRYAYDLEDGASMLLYDTKETLEKKTSMANALGFCGAILF